MQSDMPFTQHGLTAAVTGATFPSPEEQVLLTAAYHVLLEAGRALHHTEIQRSIAERGLVGTSLIPKLEVAILREVQRGTNKFKMIEGQNGYYGLGVTQKIEESQQQATAIQQQATSQPVTVKQEVRSKVTDPVHSKLNGSVTMDRDRQRYRRLRKYIKNMLFLNAAICDEVSHVEEKVTKVKEERKFLLKRLLQHQTLCDTSSQVVVRQQIPSPGEAAVTSPASAAESTAEKVKPTKKKNPPTKKLPKEQGSSSAAHVTIKTKVKKSKDGGGRRMVQPIPLDNTGRPMFPIMLGSLTVHSLGEIIPDRPKFHTAQHIYPVGYCCTRVYASMADPHMRCLYTCKILDEGDVPKFEVSPEEEPDYVLCGDTPSHCHSLLLQAVNNAKGVELTDGQGRGEDFFGLTHPTVQNLIQSCPGARKCSAYKWVKFDVCKSEQDVAIVPSEDDISINFEVLQRSAASQQNTAATEDRQKIVRQQMTALEPTTSLRSLLTSRPLISTTNQ